MSDPRVSSSIKVLNVTSPIVFIDFDYLSITDSGADGFILEDGAGNFAIIPTGIQLLLKINSFLCTQITIKAPLSGLLNALVIYGTAIVSPEDTGTIGVDSDLITVDDDSITVDN
jgi:hypothetical protein